MSYPLLSICIPTFNRARYLEECLGSVKNSWVPGIEVVVSDNASTDETREVLSRYEKELPLRWQRQETNLGFDRNCADVVAMATGDYCWILGSDDCVKEGALAKLVSRLSETTPDIYHFGYVQADVALRPVSISAPEEMDRPVGLSLDNAASYFASIPNVSLLFAFISAFIFRRTRWAAQHGRTNAWLGSHYVHTFMLHSIVADGASLLSTNESFVIARGGNPNEINSVVGKFLWLDSTTLARLVGEIYGGSRDIFAAFGQVFRRSYRLRTLLSIAAGGGITHMLSCRTQLVMLGYRNWTIDLIRTATSLGVLPRIWGMAARLRTLHRSLGLARK